MGSSGEPGEAEKRKKRAGAARRRVWKPLAALVCSAEETMERAELRLVSICEERARMLQKQFGFTVNHVHALSILISIFNFEKNPSDRTSRWRRRGEEASGSQAPHQGEEQAERD
jgi:hypothetical protein